MANPDQPPRGERAPRRRETPQTPRPRPEPVPEIQRPDIESGTMTSEKLARVRGRMQNAQSVEAEDIALGRDENEDRMYRDDAHGVYAVFDGVGGVAGGRIAAIHAHDTLTEAVATMPPELSLYRNAAKAEIFLQHIARRAHATIDAEQQAALAEAQRIRRKDPDRAAQLESEARMATTAVIVHILRDSVTKEPYEALIAHLGDSRAYVLRGGDIAWRTTDHSRVQDRIDADELPKDADQIGDAAVDARLRPEERAGVLATRNSITKAVDGSAEPLMIDRVPLYKNDTILLTSDGVHDNLTDREIAVLASPYTNNPEAVARVLHEHARHRAIEDYERRPDRHPRAKDDDVTTVAVRINVAQPRASFRRGDNATRKM